MHGERPTPAGLIDAAPWTAYQIRTVLLITLTILFDGMDQNLLAITVPALAEAWHVEAQQFANVTALGTLAILVGSATAGLLADRIGRRWTLIGSVLLYGAASLCGAFAWDIDSIGAVRLVSGLGLGAAQTTAVVAIAEHTPARRRAVVLSTTILGIPLGGIGAGAIGAALIGVHGWQSVYIVGGMLPLMLALAFIAILPETPAYLALRGDARIMAYFARMRVAVPERLDGAVPSHGPARGNPLALLSPELRRNTLLLWAGAFASLLISYEILGWMPALLARNGASVALTSASVSYLSIGSLAGGVLASVLIYLFGSRRTAIGAGLLSVLVTLWLATMFDRAPTGPAVLWSLPLALVGVAIINGLFYAIMPSVYPEHVRGAGIGIGMAVGRAGAVASAYVGAWALGGGGALFFGIAAAASLVVLAGFGLVDKHQPRGW